MINKIFQKLENAFLSASVQRLRMNLEVYAQRGSQADIFLVVVPQT